MSAPVQLVALLLGSIEFVLRVALFAAMAVCVLPLLMVLVIAETDFADLITPYLWRKALP